MIPPHNSLVKYDNPILISTSTSSKPIPKSSKAAAPSKDDKSSTNNKTTGNQGDSDKHGTKEEKKEGGGSPSKGGKGKDSHVKKDGKATTQTEDILNSILPPREWTEDGQLWVQYVSSTPATRLDVINLQESLDHNLQSRQARETGICPIREELYAQCFDELIRQVTINCAERGLLLLRVRDEVRMTTSAYQTLYESSIAFGMRKALISNVSKNNYIEKISTLTGDNSDLEKQVQELGSRIEIIKKKEEERKLIDKQKHMEEVERLKATNEGLKISLESLLSAPKK